jgi:hypothetical protein
MNPPPVCVSRAKSGPSARTRTNGSALSPTRVKPPTDDGGTRMKPPSPVMTLRALVPPAAVASPPVVAYVNVRLVVPPDAVARPVTFATFTTIVAVLVPPPPVPAPAVFV